MFASNRRSALVAKHLIVLVANFDNGDDDDVMLGGKHAILFLEVSKQQTYEMWQWTTTVT